MAYEIGYDVVVYDDFCDSIGDEYEKCAKKFESALCTYQNNLQDILNHAVMDGALADNLKKFKEEAKTLQNEANGIAAAAKQCSKQFFSDMDTADSYLF
jgi:hypothetical protein